MSDRCLHCAIDPTLDRTRARRLATQLLGMIGAPFGIGTLGDEEPGASARVAIVRAGASSPEPPPTLTLTLGDAWRDPAHVRVAWRNDLALLCPTATAAPPRFADDGRVLADVLGALEFLLEGEERTTPDRDERGRFRATYSVLDALGLDQVAVLDRYAAELRRILRQRAPAILVPEWGDTRFVVALTHDVDGIFGRRPQLRKLVHYATSGTRLRRGLAVEQAGTELLRLIGRPRLGSPQFDVSPWVAFERREGVSSTFNFFGDYEGGRDPDDAWYSYAEHGRLDGRILTLGEAVRVLASDGFEIGLHTSIASFGKPDRVRRERDSLAVASGQQPLSVRAHHLRFDSVKSSRDYAACGLRYDLSASGVGFIRGTGFPYAVGDEPHGTLVELPTVLQDDHLLKDWRMGLPPVLAQRRIEQILGEVRDQGGGAAILFHPDHEDKIPLYRSVLVWIRENGGRCVTAAELGSRWRRRSTPLYET